MNLSSMTVTNYYCSTSNWTALIPIIKMKITCGIFIWNIFCWILLRDSTKARLLIAASRIAHINQPIIVASTAPKNHFNILFIFGYFHLSSHPRSELFFLIFGMNKLLRVFFLLPEEGFGSLLVQAKGGDGFHFFISVKPLSSIDLTLFKSSTFKNFVVFPIEPQEIKAVCLLPS